MDKTFDINRLMMVIRWDIHTYWKKYLGITAGLAIALTLFFLIQLNSLRMSNENGMEQYCEAFFIERMSGIPMGISFAAFLGLSSCIFINMKEKFEREAFLMLPANNIEKFVARLLIMGVGSFIFANIACAIGDLVQMAFSFYFTPGHHSSVMVSAVKPWLDDTQGYKPLMTLFFKNHFDKACLTWSIFVLLHSFCIMGGTIYRKHPMILTAASVLAIGFIFIFSSMKLADWGFFDLLPKIDYDNKTVTQCVTFLWTGVFLGIAILLYYTSYKIFTRMQVICNKWVNA